MSEYLPPSMHEAPPANAQPQAQPAPVAREPVQRTQRRPAALGRLISLIVTVALAWALTVAITAWLLGLFLSRG